MVAGPGRDRRRRTYLFTVDINDIGEPLWVLGNSGFLDSFTALGRTSPVTHPMAPLPSPATVAPACPRWAHRPRPSTGSSPAGRSPPGRARSSSSSRRHRPLGPQARRRDLHPATRLDQPRRGNDRYDPVPKASSSRPRLCSASRPAARRLPRRGRQGGGEQVLRYVLQLFPVSLERPAVIPPKSPLPDHLAAGAGDPHRHRQDGPAGARRLATSWESPDPEDVGVPSARRA